MLKKKNTDEIKFETNSPPYNIFIQPPKDNKDSDGKKKKRSIGTGIPGLPPLTTVLIGRCGRFAGVMVESFVVWAQCGVALGIGRRSNQDGHNLRIKQDNDTVLSNILARYAALELALKFADSLGGPGKLGGTTTSEGQMEGREEGLSGNLMGKLIQEGATLQL